MDKLYIRKIIQAARTEKGMRLDRYLSVLPELKLSRSFIQQVIADGGVSVDGQVAGKNYRLRGGESIVLTIPPPPTPSFDAENIPLEFVYEDESLAVINKPAGMVVHPAPGHYQHTLANALLFHLGRLSDDKEDIRPGIIHRLDQNTSGLLLVAKNDAVARLLREQMVERKIVRIYQALICGRLPQESGKIDLPIGRSLRDRKKMAVTKINARQAVTHYKVLDSFPIVDYVEIRLETGRTHQIRVHFSHLNRPVLGDPEYGGRLKWIKGIDPTHRLTARRLLEVIDRQALHAKTITFTHPVSGKEISVTSELPADICRVLELLRKKYR